VPWRIQFYSIIYQEYVTDADEGQDIEFSRGRQFLYTPAKLSKILGVSEPIKIYANGNIQTEITFDEEMQVCIFKYCWISARVRWEFFFYIPYAKIKCWNFIFHITHLMYPRFINL